MRGRREEQGGWWWKVFGYIQSQCAAFCVAFKVTKNGHGKRGVPFFVCVCFLLTSPSLYSWNWRPENTAAPGVLPTTPLFKVRPALGLSSKPISGCSFVVKYKIQKWLFYPESVFFLFFCFLNFKQSLKIKMLIPEQCVKVKTLSFHWNDSRNWCCKAVLKYFMSHHYVYLMS